MEYNYQCDCGTRESFGANPEHVHEVTGSVRLAELQQDAHNHRFAGVTGEAIFVRGGHIHKLRTTTDFYEDHSHEIHVHTGRQIMVGENRHVHFIDSNTQIADGHEHEFIVASLIENPIGD